MTIEETYCGGGINSTWYARIIRNTDGTATITLHDSLHNTRDIGKHPETMGGFRMVETPDRIVTAIEIWEQDWQHVTTFPVANPANVFSYPGFTQ